MTYDPSGVAGYGRDVAVAADAVSDLIEANRDASHAFRMMAEILEGSPLVSELRNRAETRDGFASRLAVLMARYGHGAELPEGGTSRGTRYGWRMHIAAALQKDDQKAVLGVAAKGNEAMQREYDKTLNEKLPDDLRLVIISQLKEIEETADWIQSHL
ncbi:MAG: PA2169 family four-helix-bundle protein [Acidimicrobiia bacterium]|nr:PA2169 family four-helix-bundle protein [Acidimicrobiia bacterium]